MAYDSAAAADNFVVESTTPKAVRHAGGGLVGAIGSWRIINMINEMHQENITPDFIISLLKVVKHEEDWSDSELLFVSPGKPIVLFQTQGFSTVEIKSPFMAIGAGGAYSLGYLSGQDTITDKQLKSAVGVAAKWSPYVTMPAKLIKVIN